LAAGGTGGVGQHAEASGQGNVVVQIVGDGNSVVVGYAYLTLTRYLNRRVPAGQGDAGGEAALLSPYALGRTARKLTHPTLGN
jgi:hypothetical protein